MKKAILFNLKPSEVKDICTQIGYSDTSGFLYKKTIIVMKKKIKNVNTPFKCYIYCQRPINNQFLFMQNGYNPYFAHYTHVASNKYDYIANSQVVGEFVCDKIENYIDYDEHNEPYWNFSADIKEIERIKKETCLTLEQMIDYIGDSKNLYGYHITNLKIYDKPKELRELKHKVLVERDYDFNMYKIKPLTTISHPCCYVEDLGE